MYPPSHISYKLKQIKNPQAYIGFLLTYLVLGSALFRLSVSLCVSFTNFLIERYFIMMITIIVGNFYSHSINFYTFGLSVIRQFWFLSYVPPRMFLRLDVLFKYRIEHVTFEILYILFVFSNGCSTCKFQALQLIVLEVFGVVV